MYASFNYNLEWENLNLEPKLIKIFTLKKQNRLKASLAI